MAIAKMSHVRLVGLKRDKNKILNELSENGLFEVRDSDSVQGLDTMGTDLYRELKLKQARIVFALDILKGRHNYMQTVLAENKRNVKKGYAQPLDYKLSEVKYDGGRTLITRADFSDAAAKEYELMCVCDELEKMSAQLVELKSRAAELDNTVKLYMPYRAVGMKLSEFGGRDGDVLLSLYTVSGTFTAEDALKALPCAYEIIRGAFGTDIIAVYRKKYEDQLSKEFASLGLIRCPFKDDCTAKQKIQSLKAEREDIDKCIFELTLKVLGYEKYVQELRILYDVLELDIERAEATEKFAQTDSTFILEGWLPERVAVDTVRKVEQLCENVFVQLLEPEAKDEPPTLVENNAIVKPYEQITDMYSSPRYREIDPNPIMAIFYFLFFGIMVGDAAYGLILAVAGILIGRSKKFDSGAKRLALLVGMGGISAILWGILFGGYFAIDFGDTKVALWFNPLENPMMMLILSVVLGCVQMTVGYIIKFVALCKEGKPFSAIFDCGSIIMLFIALGCVGINMFVLKTPVYALTVVSIVLVCLGLGLMIIFGGRNNKNVFGKIFGGFKGLYGLVNLLSDALSYCRLFGLNLASCAIGLAFNSLGGILFGIPVIGYVLGVILLIPLHVFNLALGVLSAYVHDARLQFLEFYSKFYDGGGRMFSPLGGTTRYVRFG